MRRVLVAVSGLMLAQFLEHVLSQLEWEDTALLLLHVVDSRPLREFGLAAGSLAGRAGQAGERVRQMGALSAEEGRKMLADAETIAAARLPAGTEIRCVQREGIPEHEIIAVAHELDAGLIVLGAAEDPAGPPPAPPGPRDHPPGPRDRRPGPPGPPGSAGRPSRFTHRHLTPTVRFVVDHAPCDVLLLYAEAARRPAGETRQSGVDAKS